MSHHNQNDDLQKEFLEALILLGESAALFRTYEKNHRLKSRSISPTLSTIDQNIIRNANIDTLQKAAVNSEIAEKIEAFINKNTTLFNPVISMADESPHREIEWPKSMYTPPQPSWFSKLSNLFTKRKAK